MTKNVGGLKLALILLVVGLLVSGGCATDRFASNRSGASGCSSCSR